MQALTYGGFDITHYCFVRVERPVAAPMAYETESVSGRDGSIVRSASLEPFEATAHCTLKRKYLSQWADIRIALAEALSKRTPQRLTLPDEDGLWRMATATLQGALTTPVTPPLEFDVLFTCNDPRAYGAASTVAVPSGGSATFTLQHDHPSIAIAAAQARRDATTQLWGLRFDGGDFVRVKLAVATAVTVSIDCSSARHVTVAGQVSMITPESDWPRLLKGSHTVQMDQGTGAATLTITERCL